MRRLIICSFVAASLFSACDRDAETTIQSDDSQALQDTLSQSESSEVEQEIASASTLFAQFGREEFMHPEQPRAISGPMVPLDDHREIHSATLRYQAEVVAIGGISSFDVAFQHLDDERLYMRWIAVESLYQITGNHPLWYFFAKPGQTWNSDSDWADRAKALWKQWKAEQSSGGDP